MVILTRLAIVDRAMHLCDMQCYG